MRKLILATLVALSAPSASMAVTFSYDAAADYGASVFTYGYGTAGVSFTEFPFSYNGGCFGSANFACKTPGSDSIQPIIGLNTGAVTTLGTLALPNDRLVTHPYSTIPSANMPVANSDAILVFTVPTSGNYTFNGFFDRLDETLNGGNGVIVSRLLNGVVTNANFLYGPQFSQVAISGSGYYTAGTQLGFAVGNNGDYNYDSTGLSLQISGSVPEPASWAMMVAGFGLLGFGMRSARRRDVAGFIN